MANNIGVHPFTDRAVKMARAYRNTTKIDLSNPQIITARRMAHDGFSAPEIAQALGLNVTATGFRRILFAKYGIKARWGNKLRNSRLGEDTTLSNHGAAVDYSAYKPAVLA